MYWVLFLTHFTLFNSRTLIPINTLLFGLFIHFFFSSFEVLFYAQSGVFCVSIFCRDFFALYFGDEMRLDPSVFVVFHMYPTTGTP